MKFSTIKTSYGKIIISLVLSLSIVLVSTQLFSEESNKKFNLTSPISSIQEDFETMHNLTITPDKRGNMNVAFYLNNQSKVEFQLIDNNGIVVETFEETIFTPGKHVTTVSSILKGKFTLELTIEEKTHSREIILL